MQLREKLFLLAILLVILVQLKAGFKGSANREEQKSITAVNQSQIQEPREPLPDSNNRLNQPKQECSTIKDIHFTKTDNKGNNDVMGGNHVIIFDPKSKNLDFKVSLGLTHKLYAKDANGKIKKFYSPQSFREIISDENAKLNGKYPIAAINGDYIGKDGKPQGLNISRGVEYSGPFKDKRSSFAISGGKPKERKATIQIGKRVNEILNYNVVGGNGRFYKKGKFTDICPDLGDYACAKETSRSMAAITSKGYVILLVNDANLKQAIYPSMFSEVLKGISENNCLGNIQEGMLFDGGYSTSLFFNGQIYVENSHPMGSVLLIYKK